MVQAFWQCYVVQLMQIADALLSARLPTSAWTQVHTGQSQRLEKGNVRE